MTRLIKRCNDFGAGGVSVAIGELADGLQIDLDAVPQEVRRPGRHGAGHLRVARSAWPWWWPPRTWTQFIAAAEAENLEAYQVAVVTEEPRMVMELEGPRPSPT